MKTNAELGYRELARVGDYSVGQKGDQFRAYGHEWKGDQAIVNEGKHHEVCGRGETAEEAIGNMCCAAARAGRVPESAQGAQDHWVQCDGLTQSEVARLRDNLLAEMADAAETV